MLRVSSLLIVLSFAAQLGAVPVRRAATPLQPHAPSVVMMLPDLNGEWQDCTIEQQGRVLLIDGVNSCNWRGAGWINEDGSIFVWWDMWPSGTRAGVYRLNAKGDLEGPESICRP